jgi:2,3-dihydroxyethylbenzene 1,2-dioxygenase
MGIGVKDVSEWKNFATQIIGMEFAEDGERDRCYLRMDYWHHRLVLHANGSDDLEYLGFRVAGPDEFGAMQQQLTAAGIAFRVGSADEAVERHVLELLKLEDPAGNPIEIFHGPEVQFSKPFHPGRAMHGRFKTGTGGLGHCIVREDDTAAALRFFKALGMRGGVEYKLQMGKHVATPLFMHCNDRDHSIAFGVGPMEKRINHLMIEVTEIDDVGMTYDIVKKRNIPIAVELGKHSNDQMLSFYTVNPSGWLFEYGSGGRRSSYQSEYYTADVWGHAGINRM